jgi:hypothetical protein
MHTQMLGYGFLKMAQMLARSEHTALQNALHTFRELIVEGW